MQQGFEVYGRTFRSPSDYSAAKRDLDRINRIKEKSDLTNPSQVAEIRHNIEDDRYHFETLLGDDFLDEMSELLETLKREQLIEQEQNKGNKNIISKNRKKTSKNEKKDSRREQKAQKQNTAVPAELEDYDEAMKQEILRQLKKQEKRHHLMIAGLAILAAVSIGYLGFYYFYYEKNNMDYDNLAQLKDDSIQSTGVTVHLTDEKDKPPILQKYKTLYEKNKKLIGWLKIDDTNIDYPVMQTVNNEYYLDHNYNQEYDKNGSLFLDKDCDAAFPNDNMIIYGHHMKSGNMFGNLNYYSKESYYKSHPQIQFDTIYEEGLYDVMYVFRSRIYSEEEIVFKYYQFLDATSADEFASYMDEMANLSLYDTGVRAGYGDQLLTLSTCDSSEEEGRFVVVAKKVK